jgi:glycosyltransferase involved in cell wall biosynthesis
VIVSPPPHRVLVLTDRFGREDAWLLDDLRDAMIDQDPALTVDVMLVSTTPDGWIRYARESIPSGTVFRYAFPLAWRRAASVLYFAFFALSCVHFGVTSIFRGYRGALFTSVASLFLPLLLLLRLRGVPLCGVLWDFFPTHHLQIGSVPWWVAGASRLAYHGERTCFRLARHVVLMSEENRRFFERYFRIRPNGAIIQAPWGPLRRPRPVRRRTRLEAGPRTGGSADEADGPPLRMVFGGQLTHGRGIDQLIEGLREAQARQVPLAMVIYGRGPLEHLVQEAIAEGLSNVRLHEPLRREPYVDALRDFDVGLVVTATHVSVPTFPSKVVDYARAGIPTLLWVEGASDVTAQLTEELTMGIAVPRNSPDGFADACERLLEMKRDGSLAAMAEMSSAAYDDRFSGEIAARKILSAFFPET